MSADLSPFDAWRREYLSARYLEYASDAELLERARCVLRNTLALLDDYQFDGIRTKPADDNSFRELTEVRSEFALRGRRFPPSRSFVREARSISRWAPAFHAAEAVIRDCSCRAGPILVRYLHRCHAYDLAVHGLLRLAPASGFVRPSLDPARRDDEQARFLQIGPLDVRLTHALTRRTVGFTQTISYGAAIETDYYILSLSRMLSPRLFFAFGVDACVVITRPEEFQAALAAALPTKLAGQWALWNKRVDYIDPWPPGSSSGRPQRPLDLSFTKDYSFGYQQEVRFAVIPDEPRHILPGPIFIELENPSLFCNLLVLPGGDT